LLNSI